MTTSLGLYKGIAVEGGTSVLNLLATNHLRLRAGGYTMHTAGVEEAMTWDTFDLVSRATTAATIYDDLYAVQGFISDARRYHSRKSESPCYLRLQAEGGEVVNTVVYDGALEVASQSKWGPLLGTDGNVFARLAIGHAPFWERVEAVSVTAATWSTSGGIWRPSIASGDLPGRIKTLKIFGATSALEDFWIGMRGNDDGTDTDFAALWEAETYGTLGTDAATASDAAASGGYRVTVSFATTATMARRLAISPADVSATTASYDDFEGTYLVLGRIASSNDSSSFLIDTYYGKGQIENVGSTLFAPAATGYRLIELGNIEIPITGVNRRSSYSYTYSGSTDLYIYASRETGAGSLYIDCLILIPNEVIVTAKDCSLGSETAYLLVTTEPDNEVMAFSQAGNIIYGIGGGGFNLPKGGVTMVMAAQDTNSHALSLDCKGVELTVYPRYSFYRDT